jgi:hypothetical protein
MTKPSNLSAMPPPPKGLSRAESNVWRSTLCAMPRDWIRASDFPLLTELCRAVSMCDQLALKIATTEDVGELKVLLDLRDRESRRAAALSTKLRLAPQSRYDRHAAGTAARNSGHRRPWESDGADRFFKDEERS